MDEHGNMRVGQSLRDLRRKGTFPEYRVTVKAEDQAEDPSLRRYFIPFNITQNNDQRGSI